MASEKILRRMPEGSVTAEFGARPAPSTYPFPREKQFVGDQSPVTGDQEVCLLLITDHCPLITEG